MRGTNRRNAAFGISSLGREGGLNRWLAVFALFSGAVGQTGPAAADSLGLAWDGVEGAMLYQLHYGENSGSYDQYVQTPSGDAGNPPATTVTVANLSAGVTYYFAVRACAGAPLRCGTFSKEVSYQVPEVRGSADGGGSPSDGGSVVGAADSVASDAAAALPAVWVSDLPVRVDANWAFVDAASGLPNPVLIVGPPTQHGVGPGVVRVRGVNRLGFEMRFQEWDYHEDSGDRYHAEEDVPFALLRPGRHVMDDGSVWEVGTFALDGNRDWVSVSFDQPFPSPPHLFLTAQTANGADAVSVRARNVTGGGFEAALFEEEGRTGGHVSETVGYLAVRSPGGGGRIDLDGQRLPYLLQALEADDRWTPALSQRIRLEEEQSADSEVAHVDETLHILALGRQFFAQQVTSSGLDTTSLRRLEPSEDARIEWGLVRGIDSSWQTLPFAKEYDDPIVVVKPASGRDPAPAVIRLRNVVSDAAELRVQEWDYLDGNHGPEDAFYLIADAGRHTLAGLTVEADRISTSKIARRGQWEDISFTADFGGDPAVFASVMSAGGGDAVVTRISGVSPGALRIAMDEQESKTEGHAVETLGWLAIEQGSGITFDGRAVDVFSAHVDDVLIPVALPTASDHRHPTVLGDVNSTFGLDPVSVTFANPSNTAIEMRLSEEQSADSEMGHALENLGIFVGE